MYMFKQASIRFFFSGLLFITSLLAHAQQMAFNRLTVEDGLSQNSVLSIVQDHRGMLWFGTRYGLNRYDANKFKTYHSNSNSTSLSDDYVISLLCDSKKNLWVGTQNGLNRYNARKDAFDRIPISLKSNPSHQIVNSLYEDRKGNVWIVMEKSLVVFTPEGGLRPIVIKSFADRTIRCVIEDSAGKIWLGTSKGLMKAEGKFPHLSFSGTAIDGQLREDYINTIAEDRFRKLWIGTFGNGLKNYDPRTNITKNFTHLKNDNKSLINNNIRKLVFDNEGKLWIGTQEGLSIKGHTDEFTNFTHHPSTNSSLSQNSIYSLYEDKNGTMWIGTFFGGINSFDNYPTPFKVYQSGGKSKDLSNNVISSIVAEDINHLWVGTEGGGLNYINRKTGITSYYKHQSDNPSSISSNLVKVVYKDKDNNIWAGTHGGGLNLFEPTTRQFKRFFYKDKDEIVLTSEITAICEDDRDQFWVGTQTGLKVFRRQNKTLSPALTSQKMVQALNKAMVLYLFLDSQKKLWIGTDVALYLLENGKLRLIGGINSKNKTAFKVNYITEDSNHKIWIGTYHHGLYEYTMNGVFKRALVQKNGLPDNNVLAVLEDEQQNLWISTGNGLSKYVIRKNQFLNYYSVDGLAGNVFNNNAYYKSKTGEMFFGGYNGLTSFFPQEIKQNNTVPPIVLSSLTVQGKLVGVGPNSLLTQDVSFTNSIELQHDQNVFGIEFSVLNYIKPSKNRFAYQLKGFDTQWNYTTSPNISFNSLQPGSYSLLMKGSNNDGIWSEPIALSIKVLPPFWKTWKAYTLYALLLATLLFFITRFFFLREWVKKNNELTQLKLNFFTNISHEIRTHLSLIIGPADKLMVNSTGAVEDQQQLQVIKHNSESLLQLVNELMDFRRAETGNLKLLVGNWDIVSFIRDIHASFYELSIQKNIVLDLSSAPAKLDLWFDKEQLEKVFFNLLSNAFKFTANGGQIHLHIEEKKQTVEIKITDNGKGISKQNLEKLFENYFQEEYHGTQNNGYGIGLALSKSIVEIHKGSITVQSESGGTSFIVALKKGKEHFEPDFIDDQPSFTQRIAPPVKISEPLALTTTVPVLPGGTKHTILLVEDNAEIRNFITSALKDLYIFLEAEHGLLGWNIAIETLPDLIISDVMMPEMDGITFCEKLKTDPRTSHIPVILLTAKSTTANHITGLQTGADLYLTKPFSLQVLTLHMYNIIDSRKKLWAKFSNQLNEEHIATVHPMDTAFLKKVIKFVEENMYEPEFNIAVLSAKVAMSQPVLMKKIKAITGLSTNDFVKSLRLKKAAELLSEKRHTVYEVSYMVGYEDSKYFSKEFKKHFGKSPSAYG